MKQILFIAALFTVVSCGSDSEDIDPDAPLTNQTEEELEEVQDDNIKLETMDGELDSLLNEME